MICYLPGLKLLMKSQFFNPICSRPFFSSCLLVAISSFLHQKIAYVMVYNISKIWGAPKPEILQKTKNGTVSLVSGNPIFLYFCQLRGKYESYGNETLWEYWPFRLLYMTRVSKVLAANCIFCSCLGEFLLIPRVTYFKPEFEVKIEV